MILIGVGANLPFCGLTPVESVGVAARAVAGLGDGARASRIWRSPAWPDPSDPPFANLVVALAAGPGPERLLAALRRVEAAFGRVRSRPNAPRTLDLDLLAWGRERRDAPTLRLPHPGIAARAFVLGPLVDVARDWRHPVSGRRARQLFEALGEADAVPAAPAPLP